MARGSGQAQNAGISPREQKPWPLDFTEINFADAGVDYVIDRGWDDNGNHAIIDVDIGNPNSMEMAAQIIAHEKENAYSAGLNMLDRELDEDDQRVLAAIIDSMGLWGNGNFTAETAPDYDGDYLEGIYLEGSGMEAKIDDLWNDYLLSTDEDTENSRRRWLDEHQLSI